MLNLNVKSMPAYHVFVGLIGVCVAFSAVAPAPLKALDDHQEAQQILSQETVPQELPPLDEEVDIPADGKLEALGKIQQYFRQIKSFRSSFSQRAPNGQIARGVLSLERPGFARFEYQGDSPLLIVADGTTLNLVDQEIGKVTKWPLADTPLRLLLNEQLDLTGFDTEIDSAPAGIEEAIALTATDPSQPDLGRLTMYFEDIPNQDLILRGWAVIDSFGEQTVVTLGEAERNISLPKSLWTFKDPRGASRRIR